MQFLHRIGDPHLSNEERARLRCRFARQLEEAGDYEAAREIMGELWRGPGYAPAVEGLDSRTAAEVTLRAGVLTGWLGSCQQLEDAQEAAKNLISESLTRFEALNETGKVAEAEVELGYCYWRQGASDEARIWLRDALERLPANEGEAVDEVRQIALLRLAIIEYTAKRLNDALRIYSEAAPLFGTGTSHALKGRFHLGFGIVLTNLGSAERRDDYTDRARTEFAAASYHFEQAGHTRHQGYVENNLGLLLGTIHKFEEAHAHLDRAQALFSSLKDRAHVAQVADTRARVLLEEGRVGEAEESARSAVEALEGDDQQALFAEALTTHGVALARLGHHGQARLTLECAVEVAQNAGDTEGAGLAGLTTIEELGVHMSADELAVTYQHAAGLLGSSRSMVTHARLSNCASRVMSLAGLLPAAPSWQGFSLKEALHRYEARIIESALKDAGGVVTRAAHLLGFKHHTSLINKLNSRHRELLSVRKPVEPRRRSIILKQNHGAKGDGDEE